MGFEGISFGDLIEYRVPGSLKKFGIYFGICGRVDRDPSDPGGMSHAFVQVLTADDIDLIDVGVGSFVRVSVSVRSSVYDALG